MATRLEIYEELELAPIWRLKSEALQEPAQVAVAETLIARAQTPAVPTPTHFESTPQLTNAIESRSDNPVVDSRIVDFPPQSRPPLRSKVADLDESHPSAPADPRLHEKRIAQIALLNLEELSREIKDCKACGLCKGRKNAVPGMGDSQARWLIVGEAPGEEEDNQGLPFVGNSGKLLDALLARLGRERMNGIYVANVIKCRPPGNRNPEPAEVAACSPYLARQIALLKPTRIMAMGRFAAQTLLRTETSIGALRGKVHAYQGIPVHVTYHPSYLLRNLPEKARAWEDWLAFKLADESPGV